MPKQHRHTKNAIVAFLFSLEREESGTASLIVYQRQIFKKVIIKNCLFLNFEKDIETNKKFGDTYVVRPAWFNLYTFICLNLSILKIYFVKFHQNKEKDLNFC